MSEHEDGLLHKYDVRRIDDPAGKHDDCRYFVLDPRHDPIARDALATYAARAKARGYVELARDLDFWLDDIARDVPRVHDHPPYRPVCNERVVDDGQLRGACLNDDGSAP